MTTEISVAKGLAELKLLDSRIERKIDQSTFTAVEVNGKFTGGFKSREEVEADAKADYDSITSLIKRRNAIKSAIVKSNALTEIEVAGIKTTVAEAIERKTSIEYDKMLLLAMRHEYSQALRKIENTNDDMQRRLDSHLQVFLGKDGKIDDNTVNTVTESFRKENEATLVDPINLKKKIEKLQQEIEDFESEVDFELNRSNVVTLIELEQ